AQRDLLGRRGPVPHCIEYALRGSQKCETHSRHKGAAQKISEQATQLYSRHLFTMALLDRRPRDTRPASVQFAKYDHRITTDPRDKQGTEHRKCERSNRRTRTARIQRTANNGCTSPLRIPRCAKRKRAERDDLEHCADCEAALRVARECSSNGGR